MVYPYKKYKIIFTKQFKLELNEFLYKSSSQLKRSLISDKFYSKIMKSLILLQIFPERYAKIYNPSIGKYHSNLRKLLIDKYIIIYKVHSNTNEVFILHIFHSKQNYFNKL